MSEAQRKEDNDASSRVNINEFRRVAKESNSENCRLRTPLPHLETTLVTDRKSSRGSRVQAISSAAHASRPSKLSAMITPMNSSVAHQIRSAQVVLDPASVIKELLENALDAGATRIDIRVRGKAALDSIAVSDNGKGIPRNDYNSLCLSASTSKIRNFEDLDSIMTFGFRGEALSAICAISKSVSFVTRTKEDSVATSLKYGQDGYLQERRPVARPTGTTALVDALFHKLPVRRKDAVKNSSREIARCVSVVQALALVSVGVRIELKISQDIKVLTHLNASGALIPRPQPSHEKLLNLRALRHTASCVLGNKTASALQDLPLSKIASVSLPRSGASPNARTDRDDVTSNRHYWCSGLVSKASLDANGSGGRAKSSHQYIFANKRPVDFPRLTRAVNELYRRITGLNGASPVLILNLDLPVGSHDVNLSPDKRDFLIRDMSDVIAGVMGQLEALWSPKKAAEIPVQKLNFKTEPISLLSSSRGNVMDMLNQSRPLKETDGEEEVNEGRKVDPSGESVHVHQGTAEVDETGSQLSLDNKGRILQSPESTSVLALSLPSVPVGLEVESDRTDHDGHAIVGVSSTFGTERNQSRSASSQFSLDLSNPKKSGFHATLHKARSLTDRRRISKTLCPSKRNVGAFVSRQVENFGTPAKKKRMASSVPLPLSRNCKSVRMLSSNVPEKRNSHPGNVDEGTESPTRCIDEPGPRNRSPIHQTPSVLKMNWKIVCEEQLAVGSPHVLRRGSSSDEEGGELQADAAFKKSSVAAESTVEGSAIGAAELEMSRLFRQEWFRKLKILGQFNRSFIIGQLGRDLFIIDQHASDEKYNFEDLQRSTAISKQKLVRPLALEFSAQDELIVLQHKDAFRAGGFEIDYRAKKNPTQRLYLRSQPVSKSTMFVQDDLKEIVAMLKSNVLQSSSLKVKVLRPPRVRAMFASRACRKSVMIGTALQKSQMRKIVNNLTSIEHPWTCPHGRPTMRHLCTLPEPR